MKYRILFIVAHFLLVVVLLMSVRESAGQTVNKDKPASTKISDTINNSTLLKLSMLDLSLNVLGLGWDEREKIGAGRDSLIKTVKNISTTYGIDIMKTGFSLDVEEMNGAKDEKGNRIYVKIPNTWSEIVRLDKNGKLPIVKFRSGFATLHLKTMSVSFNDKTECIIDGKEYEHNNGKWFEKQIQLSPKVSNGSHKATKER